MAGRQDERRHPFPRSHAITLAFIDALVDRPDLPSNSVVARAVSRRVDQITRLQKGNKQ